MYALFFALETHLEYTQGLSHSIFLSSDKSSCCYPGGGRKEKCTHIAAECADAGTLGAGLQMAVLASWLDRFQVFACWMQMSKVDAKVFPCFKAQRTQGSNNNNITKAIITIALSPAVLSI